MLYCYLWALKTRHDYECRGVAQLGSATGLGPVGRGFKSCHPDHEKMAEFGHFSFYYMLIRLWTILFKRFKLSKGMLK